IVLVIMAIIVLTTVLFPKKGAENLVNLDELHKRVYELYNEDQDDLAENLDEGQLDHAYHYIGKTDDKLDNLSDKHAEYYRTIKEKYATAEKMFHYENAVEDLMAKKEIDQAEYGHLKDELADFEDMPGFQTRMANALGEKSD